MGLISFIHESPFYELAALLTLAAVAGFIGVLLRQPLIVSFIAVGMLAGPSAFGIVQSTDSIELLAKLGIGARRPVPPASPSRSPANPPAWIDRL